MDYRIEIALAVIVAIGCFGLNKHFAEICRQFQKSFWGIRYELRFFRIPIYFVGAIFMAIIIGRLFIR